MAPRSYRPHVALASLDDARAKSDHHGLDSRGGAQFRADPSDVSLDATGRPAEVVGELLHSRAPGEQPEELEVMGIEAPSERERLDRPA